MKRYRIIFSLIVLAFSYRTHALTLYAEQQFVASTQQWSTLLTVRQPVAPAFTGIFPYVAAGGERMATELFDGGAPSYGYGAPGIAIRRGAFTAFTELRLRAWDAKYFDTPSTLDWRAVLSAGALREASVLALGARPFLEFYGEGVLSSADRWNVIGTAYARGGFRWRLAAATYLDAFVEPFVTLDRVGHFFNNRAAFRPGVRLGTQLGNVSIAALAHAGPHRYFASDEFNPHAKSGSRESVLLVVGGEL